MVALALYFVLVLLEYEFMTHFQTNFIRLFPRISQYPAPSTFPSILTMSPIPADPHYIMLTPPCFTFGLMLFWWKGMLEFMPKGSTLVSSDHETFCKVDAGSFRCLCANFILHYILKKMSFFLPFSNMCAGARCVQYLFLCWPSNPVGFKQVSKKCLLFFSVI